MTPATLTTWMTRLGLNKAQAATSLGIARTTLDRYLAGSKPIPKLVELACRALASDVKQNKHSKVE